MKILRLRACILVAAIPGQSIAASAPAGPDLLRRAERALDLKDIERLQRAYGYYIDASDWDNVVDLLTEDATAEYALAGVYVGKPRVRQSLELFGAQGLHQGELFDHAQYQAVIHMAPDGNSAKARVRELGMEGKFSVDAAISGGVYENEYVKVNGVWKIRSLHLYTTFLADLEKGWSHGPRPAPVADSKLRPDRPPSVRYQSFPLYSMAPCHYPHPVTGAQIVD